MRYLSGCQWSCWRTGVIWSMQRVLVMIQAADFWTNFQLYDKHMRWRPKIKQLQLSIKDRNQGVNEDCSAVGALSAASWLLIEACSIAFKKRQTTPQPKLGNSHQNSLDKSDDDRKKQNIIFFFFFAIFIKLLYICVIAKCNSCFWEV